MFAGCGGLDVGFKNLNFDLVYACDSDASAVACYRHNVDARIERRDVNEAAFLDDLRRVGRCDVVIGGFPCQGFSKAGPKREDDERNSLYLRMRQAVELLRPRLFLAENVDGIEQNFDGIFVERIRKGFTFGELAYDVDYRVLDAHAFGVPQYRRRAFFVGRCRPAGRPFEWPAPSHERRERNGEFKVASDLPLFAKGSDVERLPLPPPRTIRDAIADLRRLDVPNVADHAVANNWPAEYEHVVRRIGPGQKLCNVRHSPTSVYTWQVPEAFGPVTAREQLVLETISRHRRHKKYGNIPNGNPLPVAEIEMLSGLREIGPEIESLLAKNYLKPVNDGYDLKGAMFCSGLFKRPVWDEPSPTVLTNFHNPRYFLHPSEPRPFTLRECARLQSFDDSFEFQAAGVSLLDGYRLVGNAVAPRVGHAFAAAFRKELLATEIESATTKKARLSMKLPIKALSLPEQLQEFDIWITPSLREIRDTVRFKQELDRIAAVFEALAAATNDFASIDGCKPAAIAETYTKIAAQSGDPSARFFDLASTLFLVSGKSDNNAKCQLPIYLRDRVGRTTFPRVSAKGKISEVAIPRVLKAEAYMDVVAGLSAVPTTQAALLGAFVSFVLSDDGYMAQLWSIGRSFVAMKALGHHRELISPLVTFQVRGSVSASGGHVPENMLRDLMGSWGLQAGSDFNVNDAIVGADHLAVEKEEVDDEEAGADEEGDGEPEKTRAYDFVLPFRVAGWDPHLLIQSQFYAGDSGSVSHKNVDQTSKSRQSALAILPDARFIEYVDGAGYFASLNGDLKKLLAMQTTRSFIQVRTAPIRLRRELQAIGFLTPLEVAHAALATDGSAGLIAATLEADGYAPDEVQRVLQQALDVGMLVGAAAAGPFDVPAPHRDLVRRYLLLDVAARQGAQLDPRDPAFKGHFIVPGYGPFHGLRLDDLGRLALASAPALKPDWSTPAVILGDIRWLCERGFAMTG